MNEKQPTDWQAVEVAYRMGVESLRSIAATHNCTEGAIRKRAKRDDWPRDLHAKVRARADNLVRKAEVRKESPSERETVEANATLIARIRMAHRSDIRTARALAMHLLAELEHQTVNQDLFQHLRELVITGAADEGVDPERVRKLTEAFDRALSLGSRIKMMKDLADTLRILVDKEREAFGIGDDADKPASDFATELAAFVHRIHDEDSGRLQFTPPRTTH